MHERNIVLEGAPNFRDLGGLPTVGGGRIRTGRLFRSEGFARLNDSDLDRMEPLAIRLVVDLRTEGERERFPTRWPEGLATEFLHIPIITDAKAGDQGFLDILGSDFSKRGAEAALCKVYSELPHGFRKQLPLLFNRLTTAESLPAVIHCQAGKDRTGFVAALLLHALGVPMEVIREDYCLSARYYRDHEGETIRTIEAIVEQVIGRKVPAGMLDVMLDAKPEFLDAAFATIDHEFGSIDAYLENAAGLDESRKAKLRRLLVDNNEPASG